MTLDRFAAPSKKDCYSEGERAWMVWTQELRGRLFRPLLELLGRVRVLPDHLTLLALLSGLAFYPVFPNSPVWALGVLFLHVLLDGIDGPLARYQGTESPRGSFTDTACDQVVVTVSTIALMKAGLIGIEAGVAYVFVYGVVVAFAMVRNALAIPYSWLVRPRFVVYAWIPVELFLLPGSIEWLLWLFSGLLTLKMLSGFLKIRGRL